MWTLRASPRNQTFPAVTHTHTCTQRCLESLPALPGTFHLHQPLPDLTDGGMTNMSGASVPATRILAVSDGTAAVTWMTLDGLVFNHLGKLQLPSLSTQECQLCLDWSLSLQLTQLYLLIHLLFLCTSLVHQSQYVRVMIIIMCSLRTHLELTSICTYA